MGGTKLCLLLLLGTCALAQQDVAEGQSPTCLLARRFKNFRRFVYQYEAETLNGVTGASNQKNGPKVSCKVEIDVPQTCSFIVRTTECSLSEAVDIGEEGEAVFAPVAGEAFEAAMAKNALKITVEGLTDIKLYPEEDEPVNILNIKRGIVSALVVPVLEEEKNKEMATVHGVCDTDYVVNSMVDIATDVTVTRDLSRCDSFNPQKDHISPIALFSGMNYPLSKLISSTQSCNYIFDNQKKHMTSGTCTEKHLFLPFSHQNEYGVSTMVKQTLTLQETSKINDRIFDINEANVKFLPMEADDDKAPVQTKDAAIAAMNALITLGQNGQGHQRASTFQKIVSELRGLKTEVLNPAALEMMDMSSSLTMQALVQCGTPECSSAMLAILRTFDSAALEVDAAIYALGLLPNPSRLLAKDMLAMAQYKQSKPIMYALSNVVRRLYQAEGHVTPEINAVYEFVASILGADCAGDKEMTFLTLRVVGNMGEAMEAADPAIKTTLLKCMRQPATTLSVQLAAIQAFRHMSVADEVRSNLQRVSQYAKGAVQKRLAAYLILMRKPEASDLELVRKVLNQEQNPQVKAFVTSHIYNIISSKDPETQKLGRKIVEVLEDIEVDPHTDYTTASRNYKMGMEQANVKGNIIFDPSSQLPREVLLETTLKAFGYNMDIWEFGMEGKGFEPTIESLFGKNGFFPDTISKAMYWSGDKMPSMVNEVLEKLAAPLGPKKVPENIIREIVRNFNKLAKDLQAQDSPEAMAYLRIMGSELGYIKGSDLKFLATNAVMYGDILLRILPAKAIQKLLSGTENEIFAHYIFMDNKFSLPTAAGFPLKFALSGTFAPGAKGGIRMSPNMELSFMPSVGVEFVTQMGIRIPEFFFSAIEMHTNMYHESALNAKVTVGDNQVKLSIPAPQRNTQLLRISNRLLTVAGGHATLIPPKDEDRTNVVSCNPLFSGVNYCTTVRYSVTGVDAAAPYFPLNGETKFALDIAPTGEVTEYTATIAYELLNEGKEGRQKVDSLKLALRAEGAEPMEATATMKYNRNRNVLTTNVHIPDYDVEAGIRVGITDSNAKGKSIVFEITNKNIPQLSLIGRAKLEAMKEGMVQVQLLVPSLNTDAALTATMTNADKLTLQLKSDIKALQSTSVQAIIFNYGEEQAEVQLMSNMNSDIKMLVPYNEAFQAWLRQFVEDILDQQVIKTDMNLRHIVNKGLEAGNIWIEKISADVPYVETMKSSLSELAMPSMPENLFMNVESTLKYQFNKDHMTITIPLPLGGTTSEDLRIPPMLTVPHVNMPEMGLDISPREIQLPTFTIPSEHELILPLMGMVEVSAMVNSNLYNWEGTVSVGNNTLESPSYIAKFNVMAESPIELLSFTSQGSAEIADTPEETLKATIDVNLKHKLIDSSFSATETVAISNKVLASGNYNIQASSPLGVQTSLYLTSQCSLDPEMFTGDTNMDGSLTIGSTSASTTFSQTFSVEPQKREARTESTLRVTSPILEVTNKIKAEYADEQLLIESNTDLNNDPVKHTTKFSIGYKEAQFTIQSDSLTKADERMVRSQIDFTATRGEANIRVENQADDTENRAYSLISGSINPNAIEINADASLNIFASRASHKATLTLNTDGLTTSCTTTAQSSPMHFENVFNGGIDYSGATVSVTTKGAMDENSAELNVEGKLGSREISLNSMFKGSLFAASTRNGLSVRLNEDGLSFSNSLVGSLNDLKTESTHSLTLTLKSLAFRSKTDNFVNERNYYKHDITADMAGLTTTAILNSDLKILNVNFVNEAQLNAEPYKIDLTGSVAGIVSEEELKHTFEFSVNDMKFSAKCNTNGKLLGVQMAHLSDIELADFAMKFNSVANLNSPSLRVDTTVKAVAEPFTLSIVAILNSNGEVVINGQHSGELYNNFLMKVEPLAFTHEFECRASTTHELANGDTAKSSMTSKFNSIISSEEQSVKVKMTSHLNDHAFDQELNAFNNAEDMGVELTGAVSTNVFDQEGENKDYSISGFVKYNKNSDSHFIQIPFLENLPVLVEDVKITVMKMMDTSVEMLKDMNTQFDISGKVQEKVSELKQVIDTFDINMFIQDFKLFLQRLVNTVARRISALPIEEIEHMLEFSASAIIDLLKKYHITDKIYGLYSKIEEILSSYEIEQMVERLMDEIVEILKTYQVKERISSVIEALKSVDIEGLFNTIMAPVKELVNQLYQFDFNQMMDDMNAFLDRMLQKIKSFDYETLNMELKEKITEMTKVPCFGKLYGELKVVSPEYSLTTTAKLQNTTTTSDMPQFEITLNSKAATPLDLIAYTLDAAAHITMPEMNRVSITENVKAEHTAFSLDHQGTLTLYGLSAQGSAQTTAKATTDPYTAELVSNVAFDMENEMTASMDTTYNHNINMPLLNIFSEASANQKTVAKLEDGALHLKINNDGKAKYAIQDFSDEGTHKSDMEVVTNIHTIKLTLTGATNCNHLKMDQNVDADICLFSHVIIDAKAETDTPFLKNSVAELKVQARIEELKVDVSASHNADLSESIEGTLSNSVVVLVKPSEFFFDTKNKGNTKVALPFTLPGKMDYQNDIAITLNTDVQQASWTGLARYNQNKYSHYFNMDNGEREIQISAQMNGEANLDVLKEPIAIPEMTVPFLGIRTPTFEEFSLWEDTHLSTLLTTTQQTFDMDAKLKYMKNPETITIDIDLAPIFDVINRNSKTLHKNLLAGKDTVVSAITNSYEKGKAEYEKYSVDMPKTIVVPAYKVPLVNVEMSSFTIPLPDLSLVTMPALHVPSAISKMTLPKITLPKMQNSIVIPAMGDLTYEFSLKTPVITVKADASAVNQEKTVLRIQASSSSEFEVMACNIEGISTLNTETGMKLDTVLSVKHMLVDGNHESAISMTSEAVDATVTNSLKVSVRDLELEVNQEMYVNAQEGVIVSVFSPSTGLVGLQMQTKSPAQVKGRLYGRYPSEPSNDVDIIAVKMSVVDSEKLNLQTAWNMELPYELMLGLKEKVPAVLSAVSYEQLVSDPISKMSDEITKLSGILEASFEYVKEQGKAVLQKVAEIISALNLSDLTTKISESGMMILEKYQKSVQTLLEAVLTFLKETQFQIPGYEEKMSGLEVYQTFSTFVADFSEEALVKVPEFFASKFETVLEQIKSIEFTLPGSSHIVSGREILEDLFVFLEKVQGQVISIVKRLGDIQLEDVLVRLSEFINFAVGKTQELINTLTSLDVDQLLNWMNDVYNDAINSEALRFVTSQIQNARNIVDEYVSVVRAKLGDLFADMSIEQLSADIQSWIDLMVKRLNAFHNKVIEFLKDIVQHVQPFVRMSDRQMDIDIPLPFAAN